jgi:hypothetical protein
VKHNNGELRVLLEHFDTARWIDGNIVSTKNEHTKKALEKLAAYCTAWIKELEEEGE